MEKASFYKPSPTIFFFFRRGSKKTRESGVHVEERECGVLFWRKMKEKKRGKKKLPPHLSHVDQHVLPGNTWIHTPRTPSHPYTWVPTSHNRACSLVPPLPDTLTPHNHLNSFPLPLSPLSHALFPDACVIKFSLSFRLLVLKFY